MLSQLTIMIFKGHLPSRKFQIPLRWIPWLSLTTTAAVVSLLALGLLSIKQGFKIKKLTSQINGSQTPAPAELAELAQLRQEIEKYKNTATTAVTSTATPTPSLSASDSPDLPEITSPHGGPLVQSKTPAAGENKISIDHPILQFTNNRWNIKFNILYQLQDGGFQQGRFILIAHGPGLAAAFPKRAFQFSSNTQPLVDLGKGETFSVARFREVKAEFYSPEGRDTLKNLQILVVDPQGKLLINKTIPFQTQSL